MAKKNGYTYKKGKAIPAKANKQQQQLFLEAELEPLLDNAIKKPDEVKVYFVDAAHFIYGAILGYFWSLVTIIVKSAYGRKRFNVLGALDSVTNEVITESNDSYINSDSIINLLRKLRFKNGDDIEINLVLDNARYQYCQKVWDEAKELKINLVYLPPYSPNLNLIERLWRLIRNDLLANKYYDTFTLFGEGITKYLETVHTDRSDKINSLMTHNFQILGH